MKPEILISGDGTPTIRDGVTGATFHSRHGAVSESRHIFINNGLLYAAEKFGPRLSVLEIGFGSGLNAALTLLECERLNLTVRFTSIEKYPIDPGLAEQYGNALPAELQEAHKMITRAEWNQEEDTGKMRLSKLVSDFCSWEPATRFHLVYFDAFAPVVAPGMWEESRFAALAGSLVPDGALVTFCAQGEVRRRMKRSGFAVERLSGAPGKREMTRAIRL